MSIDFNRAFQALTDHPPFPWQQSLYERFGTGEIPTACTLPTGLGKTSVIAVWLIALAHGGPVPRRLVYVVNRRTVVDQTTEEAEKYRRNAAAAGVPQPVISTLRGQFADNREWSADPSRPAIIAGTVDMIGSRLLFSGYGVGFKSRPLHAGFLGQDVLLVHDEAHLELAFQELIVAIQKEQHERERTGTLPWPKLRVMEMTATSRGHGPVLKLSDKDREVEEVRKRIHAKKTLVFHENKDAKKLADEIAALALKHDVSGRAVLVFVRTVDDAEKVAKKLPKDRTKQLTGTLRGLERDQLVESPIFRRFLPKAEPGSDTVYLVCTSAGEVGVNISADHLVCDLSTFDSMAQRLGRVNRFGNRDDTLVDVVHPTTFDEKKMDERRRLTLELLRQLSGEGSPAALDALDPETRVNAFAPHPTILPTSDILFDAWALTTVRDKLPGRPKVEPYLHGLSDWQPPETHVAWREEVRVVTKDMLETYKPRDLLDAYPLKPHELLRDISKRVFGCLKKLKASPETPVWVVAEDDSVTPTTLADLINDGEDEIAGKTVLLPPVAGGLEHGILTGDSSDADDVADEWLDADRKPRRLRVHTTDANYTAKTEGLRRVCRIELPGVEDEDAESQFWDWFERPTDADTDGSRASQRPVLWKDHVDDVVVNATDILSRLPLPDQMKQAVILAAKFHDHGKRRKQFQTVLGNFNYPDRVLAKSGKTGGRVPEQYRHEFGSLVDLEAEPEFLAITDSEQKELIRHLIAVHHGRGRPHFSAEEAFDPEYGGTESIAAEVPRRFARLQRKYGRWGLAYLESLLRAADYAASAKPSRFEEDQT